MPYTGLYGKIFRYAMQILRRYVLPTTKTKPGKINKTFTEVSNGGKSGRAVLRNIHGSVYCLCLTLISIAEIIVVELPQCVTDDHQLWLFCALSVVWCYSNNIFRLSIVREVWRSDWPVDDGQLWPPRLLPGFAAARQQHSDSRHTHVVVVA